MVPFNLSSVAKLQRMYTNKPCGAYEMSEYCATKMRILNFYRVSGRDSNSDGVDENEIEP